MVTTEIVIRQADINDIQSIKEIGSSTFYETFVAYNTKEDMDKYLAETFNNNRLQLEISDLQNKFFIAIYQEKTIGYAKMRASKIPAELQNKRAIEIERLYVSKQFHNKKVGAILMQHCLQNAINNKYETIWLGVWEHNIKATKFYERWGFEAFGTHVFVLGDDKQIDILMKKKITI